MLWTSEIFSEVSKSAQHFEAIFSELRDWKNVSGFILLWFDFDLSDADTFLNPFKFLMVLGYKIWHIDVYYECFQY